jgi:hypothetical protein
MPLAPFSNSAVGEPFSSILATDYMKFLDPNSFWNLVLFAGLVLIVLSVVQGPVAITGGRHSVRATVDRDHEHRRPLLWVGIVMILVALAFVTLTNWRGLVSPVRDGKAPKSPEEHTSLNFGPAATARLAQISISTSEPKPIATITLVARHATGAPSKFGKAAVYLGAITLFGTSRLLIYRSATAPREDEIIHYHILAPTLEKGQIIWDGDVRNKQTIDFDWNGVDYRAAIELNWFLKGEDYGVIRIYSR